MTQSGDPPSSGRDVKLLFAEASELPADRRGAFLDERCAGDPALRVAVESLLTAHERAAGFLTGATVQPATVASPQPTADAPRRIGPYKLLNQIGEGGFGTVYEADQEQPVRRRVAVKVIKPGMDTRQVIARFEQERQALAIMQHPNIAQVYDAGTTPEGRPYFVMELVRGVPITKFCDEQNYNVQQRLEVFVQVCQAVQHAHTKGVIHRDIKPTNVLVAPSDGRPVVKVIDFGIAKATQQRLTEKTVFTEHQQMIGTPEYMPPEQAEMSGLDIDTRSDVYGLGVLLYELLTGVTPFDARELRSKAFAEMQRVIREVDPPPPSSRLSRLDTRASVAATRATEPAKLRRLLKGELDWIVMKCLEKDRTRRYETATGLAADVLHYLADEPVVAGPVSAAYRTQKFVHRHRASVALASAAVLIAIAVTALYIRGIRAEQARTRAALAEAQAQRREADRHRAEAEQANQNTMAVNDFLTHDVLGAADPALTQGREVTVKQAIDSAAKSVTETFKDRPLLEASVRDALASSYDALGHTDVALPHAKAALEIRQKRLGADHADTIASQTRYALLLQYQGNFSEAEPLYRDAIDRSRRVLGADDPDTLRRMFDMGSLLLDLGKFNEAERTFREVLQGRRRALGDNHPDTAAALSYLARAVTNLGRYDEAEAYFREALQKKRQLLGDLHPTTLVSMSDMAGNFDRQGKLDEAEALYREALQNSRRVLGDDHPSTLITMGNLAELLLRRRELDEAERLLREELDRVRRTHQEQNPFAAACLSNLSSVLRLRGQLADAEAVGREGLEQCQRAYGPEHPLTIASMSLLIDTLLEERKLGEADPLLSQFHQIVLRVRGDPKRNAEYACKYGTVLARQERWAEAEVPLKQGYERLNAVGQVRTREMRDVLASMIKLYHATNRPDEAARYERELAALGPAPTRPTTSTRP